jgi:hypothetical protein
MLHSSFSPCDHHGDSIVTVASRNQLHYTFTGWTAGAAGPTPDRPSACALPAQSRETGRVPGRRHRRSRAVPDTAVHPST